MVQKRTIKDQVVHYGILLLVLLLAAVLRINTFWAPHVSGDEVHYVGLAMKLDTFGLKRYNLWGIDYKQIVKEKQYLIRYTLARDSAMGMVLKDMYRNGRGYYNNPLYNNAPGLSYLLMLSQKTIGRDKGYFISTTDVEGMSALIIRPKVVFKAQFYAVVWPYFFSLLFVLLGYLFGRMVFHREVGLIVAFLLAVNPVSILVSQHLWGDEISGVFVLLSAMLFYKGYPQRSVGYGLLAGISAGLAVLFKQTAGFFLIALVLFWFWDNFNKLRTLRGVRAFFLDPFALVFILAFIAVSGFWFLKVYQVYGSPIHKHLASGEAHDVFALLKRQRPTGFLIYLVGIPFLSPALLAAWGVLSRKIRHAVKPEKHWIFPFLIFWFFTYLFILVVFFNGKEHRYMLPAYPAIVLLAAYVIDYLRQWAKRWTRTWQWLGADEIVIILLLFSAQVSLTIIFPIVTHGAVLIIKPF